MSREPSHFDMLADIRESDRRLSVTMGKVKDQKGEWIDYDLARMELNSMVGRQLRDACAWIHRLAKLAENDIVKPAKVKP